MARVTGIGGIFLKARDPKALTAWYSQHLGIQLDEFGGVTFLWKDETSATTDSPPEGPPLVGMTVWSLFPEDTTYFGPGNDHGPQTAMVNYRVDDLDALLAQLALAGVTIDPHREDYDYGRFGWIVDLEGNRIELWQPLPPAQK
ncbi:MAG: Glyoxalase/bleomycin resistance protein/dioxygenase [Edaphobacter sp.]|nr:Glyoxalase/bleomycin resistance protein/dioxygenase [Edaphobacter sp.]